MASSDKFEILIKGESSHAAEPQNGIDAISASIDVISMINNIRKEINPFIPTIVSVGQINSKGRYNIVCDSVEIKGTVRTIDEDIRTKIHERIRNILEGVKLSKGIDYSIHLENGYDIVINDDRLTKSLLRMLFLF